MPGYVVLLPLIGAGWPPPAAIGLVVLLSLAIAYAVHRLIERPTHRTRQSLAQGMITRRSAVAD